MFDDIFDDLFEEKEDTEQREPENALSEDEWNALSDIWSVKDQLWNNDDNRRLWDSKL